MEEVKILIIDDDQINLMLCECSLRNYTTFKVNDGRKALKKFLEIKPKIIFLDYKMPHITGLEIAKQIRLIDQDCKIVIMSTYAHEEIVISKDCNKFLLKPILPSMIKKTVEELLLF